MLLELVPPELSRWVPVWVATALTGLAVLAWLWRTTLAPAYRWAKALKDKLDDFFGVAARDGVPARPGVMVRLGEYDERIAGMTAALAEAKDLAAKHDAAIADIQYHVQPNHGDSAHDAHTKQLARIESAQLTVVGTVDGLRDEVQQLRVEKTADHSDIRSRIRRLEEHEES